MTGRVFVKKVIEKLRYHHLLDWMPDKPYLELMYWVKMDRRLDLKNPRTFNEKLQWLKLYNRRNGQILTIGQPLRIRVVSADVASGKIDFEPVE